MVLFHPWYSSIIMGLETKKGKSSPQILGKAPLPRAISSESRNHKEYGSAPSGNGGKWDHLVKEIELETSLQKILRQEEEGWRLRSRILWLKGGDRNTKFFQNQCRDRQRWNTLRELKNEDGTVITGQVAINMEVRSFFENLYNDEEYVSQECMEEMVRDIPALISPEVSL